MKRLLTLLAILGMVVAAASGAVIGSSLGERASEPGTTTVEIRDPALAPDETQVLRSPGGFTGFEGSPALSGRVTRTGSLDAIDGPAMLVTGPGGHLAIQLETPGQIFALGPIEASLAPGDLVLIRVEGDTPAGILRVPGDLIGPAGGAE